MGIIWVSHGHDDDVELLLGNEQEMIAVRLENEAAVICGWNWGFISVSFSSLLA